jgi:hypothetical protein
VSQCSDRKCLDLQEKLDFLVTVQRKTAYPQKPPHKAVDNSEFFKRIKCFEYWLFSAHFFLAIPPARRSPARTTAHALPSFQQPIEKQEVSSRQRIAQ